MFSVFMQNMKESNMSPSRPRPQRCRCREISQTSQGDGGEIFDVDALKCSGQEHHPWKDLGSRVAVVVLVGSFQCFVEHGAFDGLMLQEQVWGCCASFGLGKMSLVLSHDSFLVAHEVYCVLCLF